VFTDQVLLPASAEGDCTAGVIPGETSRFPENGVILTGILGTERISLIIPQAQRSGNPFTVCTRKLSVIGACPVYRRPAVIAGGQVAFPFGCGTSGLACRRDQRHCCHNKKLFHIPLCEPFRIVTHIKRAIIRPLVGGGSLGAAVSGTQQRGMAVKDN